MTYRVPPSLYESFFDNALDGIAYCQMLFDKQGIPVDFRYSAVNKTFGVLTGLTGVVGKKVTEILPGIATSNPELLEIYGRVSMGGKPERFETHVASLKRWFLISVYCPKKGFFVASFQNITDRKEIEKNLENAKTAARNVLEDLQLEKEKLASANAKDEALLGSIGDGVIATDEKGTIVLINTTAEKLLGKKSAELMGKILSDAIPIQDEKGVSIPFEKRPMGMALASGATTTAGAAYYYMRKDKTVFPAAITVTPVRIGKKLIGAIEVFRDITKEKEIDKAKTEFVSLASHQLRTPLSTVRWYSEMLLDGDAGAFNKKQKQYLEEVQHGNLRMIELVNMLLNVSRLELGTIKANIESISLSKIVAEVLKDFEPRRTKQAVAVEVDIPASLPHLMTDTKLMRIVIENLISNAIKYTRTAGKVKIAAEVVPAGGFFSTQAVVEESIGLSVADSGIGIPAVQQDKIFEKLFRAGNAKNMDPDGAGLGLYLTQMIIRELRGQIWFTSREGEGTSFYTLLPLVGVK